MNNARHQSRVVVHATIYMYLGYLEQGNITMYYRLAGGLRLDPNTDFGSSFQFDLYFAMRLCLDVDIMIDAKKCAHPAGVQRRLALSDTALTFADIGAMAGTLIGVTRSNRSTGRTTSH